MTQAVRLSASSFCNEDLLPALRSALSSLPDLASGKAVATAARQLANATLATMPTPGGGATATRFDALMEIAAHDLALARVLEAHLDAWAILAEAGMSVIARTPGPLPIYGVWAARHPVQPLQMESVTGGYRLNGVLPFCTAVEHVGRALVIASHADEQQLLHLEADEFPEQRQLVWYCAGMDRVPATTLIFKDRYVSSSQLIGPSEFYLVRRGFWSGAAGVAACWLGGAIGVMRRWRALLHQRPGNQHVMAHWGASIAMIDAAVAQLHEAARRIDNAETTVSALHAWALATRHTVETACAEITKRLGRAMGPGPFVFDLSMARQVADLDIYLRQCHAERDLEELGGLTITDDGARAWPWL